MVLAVLCASVFAMSPHKRRKAVSEAAEAEAEEPTEGMGPATPWRSRKAVALAAVGTDAAERPNRSNSLRSKGRTSSTPRPETWCPDQMRSSEQSGDEGAGEQTSVISPDELAAYFARLAQESAPETGSSETESSEAGENDDAKEGE